MQKFYSSNTINNINCIKIATKEDTDDNDNMWRNGWIVHTN